MTGIVANLVGPMARGYLRADGREFSFDNVRQQPHFDGGCFWGISKSPPPPGFGTNLALGSLLPLGPVVGFHQPLAGTSDRIRLFDDSLASHSPVAALLSWQLCDRMSDPGH